MGGQSNPSRSQEEFMFEVTELASEMIKQTFKDYDRIPSIRIEYLEGG
jgi:hypothetical protein